MVCSDLGGCWFRWIALVMMLDRSSRLIFIMGFVFFFSFTCSVGTVEIVPGVGSDDGLGQI